MVHSSVDAALVASLFLLWQGSSSAGGSSSYGSCALVLYKRRSNLSSSAAVVPRTLSQQAMQWLENCLSMCQLCGGGRKKCVMVSNVEERVVSSFRSNMSY